MTSRRTFLQLGAGGAAVLALGGTGLALRGTVYRTPSRPLLALSPQGFSVLAAIADVMCDYGGDGLPTAGDLRVAEGIDAHLSHQHPADTARLEIALLLLENAAANSLLEGRGVTFTGSSPQARAQILEGWARAELPLFRSAYLALHGLCMGVYWASPEVYLAIGYPGPPQLQAALSEAP